MPCTKNTDGSWSCQGGGYSVNIAEDGAIQVKQGDSLSKYSMAIEGDFKHLSDFKHCRDKKAGPVGEADLKDIDNVNYIMAGETLYHMPTRLKWRLGFTPIDPIRIGLKEVTPHLTHSRASCVFKTLFALKDQPRNFRGKAGWYTYDEARFRAGIMLSQYGEYKDSMADVYLLKFDLYASNPLTKFEKVLAEGDPKKVADFCNQLAARIETEVSNIADWANVPQVIGTKTTALYFGAWMENMIRTPGTLLRCFQKAYAPNGFV